MVCARYPPLIGGTEAHVFELSGRLAARGHNVDVLTTVLDRRELGDETRDGVNITRVLAHPRGSDLHLSSKIYGRVAASDADIVHVQGYHTFVAPLTMAAASRNATPFVVTFHSGGHSSRIRRATRPIQHRALRPLLARSERLIGVSEFETEFFRRTLRLPDELFTTIPNGVSHHFLNPPPPVVEPGRTAPIVTIGRLEEYKGHHKVIEAMIGVRKRIPDARLRVVGSGQYGDALLALRHRLDLDDVVDFVSVPFSDRSALAGELRSAGVVALMSSYESQGIAGHEALAPGTRLIVAEGSALEALSRHDGVDAVHLDGGAPLVDALVRQLERADERLDVRVPTWDDTTDQIESVYESVLGASTCTS